MINVACPNLGEEEKEAVSKVIDSGMIACGSVTMDFEKKFAEYIGAKYGIATTSGTTALEVAIRALGLGKGDKILTTAYSFIATTNAILYAGATPVFADIKEDDFNISPEEVEKKLCENPDIKALLIVHLFGRPCNMDRIMEIVNKHSLILIEDCAQAHGASWKGKPVGTFGHASAYSFYPTKNMTTGEGGIVLTNDEKVAETARMLINHGMKIRYHHEIIGYNYRMTNLAASIGLCQLKKLDSMNESRKKNAAAYDKGLKNENIILPKGIEGHVYHQYTIRVKDNLRDKFVQHLENNNIGYGIFYPLTIPEQNCYDDYGFAKEYKVADTIKHQVLSLPIHPRLTEAELTEVIDVINQFKG